MGLDPVHWYIYRHSSHFYCTTTGPGGSMVGAALASQKGRGQSPVVARVFFPPNIVLLPFQPLIYVRPSK